MKQCPECSAEYEDGVIFCDKDGRSLLGTVAAKSRLCPHCANSIAEDAAQCPYCRADVESAPAPDWLIRDERAQDSMFIMPPRESSRMPKVALFVGIILCAIAAVVLGTAIWGTHGSGNSVALLNAKVKELQAKDDHIKAMEAELVKAREEAATNVKEAVDLKARLAESQKTLAAAEQRASVVNQQLERLKVRRTQVEARGSRSAERVTTQPLRARPPAKPGVYETKRPTTVREQPADSSRGISRIGRGTRINVVRSNGDWLEVVSRRGNPSGFVLRDDTTFVAASN